MTHPLCPPHQACWTRTLVGRRPFPCRLPQSTVHVEAATVKEEEQVAACKLNDATEIDRPDAEDEAVPKDEKKDKASAK